MSDNARNWLIAIAIVLIVLWVSGSFDKALAPLGLNWGECATNGFGATFCGEELERYEENVAPLTEETGWP